MRMKWMRARFASALICGSLVALCGSGALGAHVVPMNVETMADYAGQVIVGEVVSVRSYWAEDPKRIESEVLLAGVSYLKGALPGSDESFTLTVPGGQVGEMEMHLCCAPQFRTGERWMLFLLPSYKTFPVVGLYQGAFRIERSPDGIERVYDAAGGSVLGVDSEGMVLSTRVAKASPHEHVMESASVRLAPLATAPTDSLSFEAFCSQVQPVLDKSEVHVLTEPAGKRVSVSVRAVPLRRSDESTNKTSNPDAVRTGLLRQADAPSRDRKEVQP